MLVPVTTSSMSASAANSIDDLLGALTVNGQGGNNILNINDQGNLPLAADIRTYTVNATTVTRTTRVSPV